MFAVCGALVLASLSRGDLGASQTAFMSCACWARHVVRASGDLLFPSRIYTASCMKAALTSVECYIDDCYTITEVFDLNPYLSRPSLAAAAASTRADDPVVLNSSGGL